MASIFKRMFGLPETVDLKRNTIPLQEQFPEQSQDNITTFDTSRLYSGLFGSTFQRYNPDIVAGSKGGVKIYKSMLRDEQVKAVSEFKNSAILARGWEFRYDKDLGKSLSEEEQKKRIHICNEIVRQMYGSFSDAIDAIASGRDLGLSITEKVYGEVIVDGQKYVGINRLLSRDPDSFEFITDEYGILKKIRQTGNSARAIDVDIDRIIHYVHKPKWDLVYGRSDLQAAHRGWYSKDVLIKMWLVYLERFGGGITVAKRANSEVLAMTPQDKKDLLLAMQNAKSMTNIVLPPGVDMDVLFPTTTDQFEKAITYMDLAIAKALLVPNLLGLSHTGNTGAYAQSQTQLEAFFWTLNSDTVRLEECINEQLFRDLGDQNWADGDYPQFKFKRASIEHTKWVITTWKELISAKAVIPTEEDERALRSMLEMPERDEDTEQLVNPLEEQHRKEDMAAAASQAEANKQAIKKLSDKLFEQDKIIARLSMHPVSVNVAPSAPISSASGPGQVAGRARAVNSGVGGDDTRALMSRVMERVNFAVIDQRTQSFEANYVPKFADLVARAVTRVTSDEERMKDLLDADQDDVTNFVLEASDVSRLKKASADLLRSSWTLGGSMASNEITRANTRIEFSAAKIRFASLLDRAASYFDSQAFRMAGDMSDQVKRIIQQSLQNGIKFGQSQNEIVATIWERLVSKGLTSRDAVRANETDDAINAALDALWQDSEESATAYLSTLVRTNTFEAMNEARYAEFTDPELGGFVIALRYAAILDNATTQICEALHDRTFYAENPVWNEIRPPNHFNCRSVLVPITTADEWDGQEDDVPDVEPQDGFK